MTSHRSSFKVDPATQICGRSSAVQPKRWLAGVVAAALIITAPTSADDRAELPPVSAAPERLLFVDLGSYRDTVRLALQLHDGALQVRRLSFSAGSDALLERCRPGETRVRLSLAPGGWVAPKFGLAQRTVTLRALAGDGRRLRRRALFPSALLAILDGVELACEERGTPPVAAEFPIDALGPLSKPTGEGVLEIRLSIAEARLS